MRSSELRGLRWSDVDFDRGEIHVQQRFDAWNQAGAPKSKSSRRGIPMPAGGFVSNTLRHWREDCPEGPLDLVFPNGAGNPENHSNILTRGLKAAQIRAGVVRQDGKAKYALHALRHYFASAQAEAGEASLKDVQAWLGHSSFQMTSDTYSHRFTDKEADATKFRAAERALRAVATKTG